MKPTPIRAAVVSAALATMLTTAGAATATAQAFPTPDHNCVFEGENLNTLLGVGERLLGPPPCREAFADERWVRTFPSWGTATGPAGALYPADYTPARPGPMDDFTSKLRGVRIVQDIGTHREWSVTAGPEVVRNITLFEGHPFANFASAPLRPLSLGSHTTTVFMNLSAEHCDGLGEDRVEHCLPAGEFPYTGHARVHSFPRRPQPAP
ncbi:hypothetical protein ACFXDJ_14800 [Streptomyces sp. NPDC059443]|uniref:hypothetical protein n=1 Tax=unclassified Streptomyces TaxID=2593676 RepID=UPI00367EA057